MPMDFATLSPIMASSLPSFGLLGPSIPQLAFGLATGLSTYAQGSLIVQSNVVGTAGSGVGVGVGIVVNPSIIGSMNSSFISSGIIGPFSPAFATAVANAFIQSFALGIVTVASVGVGVGTGISYCIPNPAASNAAFFAGFTAAGMTGISVPQLALAVSIGLDTVLPISFGVVAVAGPPSPVPSTGIGLGKIV